MDMLCFSYIFFLKVKFWGVGCLYILYFFFLVGDVVCLLLVDVYGILWLVVILGKYVYVDCFNGKEGRIMNLYLYCSIGCKIKKVNWLILEIKVNFDKFYFL